MLAEQAGARLVNMDITYGPEIRFVAPEGRSFQQLLPTRGPFASLVGKLTPFVPQFVMVMMIRRLLVTWQHPEDALFDDGAILVNADGRTVLRRDHVAGPGDCGCTSSRTRCAISCWTNG